MQVFKINWVRLQGKERRPNPITGPAAQDRRNRMKTVSPMSHSFKVLPIFYQKQKPLSITMRGRVSALPHSYNCFLRDNLQISFLMIISATNPRHNCFAFHHLIRERSFLSAPFQAITSSSALNHLILTPQKITSYLRLLYITNSLKKINSSTEIFEFL